MIDVASLEITNVVFRELKRIIGEDLTESYDTEKAANDALRQIVEDAVHELIRIRDYPDGYTEAMIEKDLNRYHSTISRVATYEWDSLGASNETMHIENNTQRMWRERSTLFYGVMPIGRIV